MEYYRTTTAFSGLPQGTTSSVATNFNGGAAPMDIGAVNKGKGKGKHKGKGKKGNKGKGYAQQGHGYGGKETGRDKQCPTKDPTTMRKEKEKDIQ